MKKTIHSLFALSLFLTLCTVGCGAVPHSDGSSKVSFKTDDGWVIIGNLYTPRGTSKGKVLLLHERGGQALDWDSLCSSLKAAGFTVLAIDQRGAGRSIKGPGPNGAGAPWNTGNDIAAAIKFLHTSKPIGIAGASYGANNALLYAAAHQNQVSTLLLLSPGEDYNGLKAVPPARIYHGSVFIMYGKSDKIVGNGPEEIAKTLPGKNHILAPVDGSEHGTDLLNKNTIPTFTAFFLKTLGHN